MKTTTWEAEKAKVTKATTSRKQTTPMAPAKILSRLVTFDLSFTCIGWAAWNGMVQSGRFPLIKPDGADPAVRFIMATDFIARKMLEYRPEGVVYEQVQHKSNYNTTQALVGLETRVMEATLRNHAIYWNVNPMSLKKFATGSGGASKEQMMAAARARWPHYFHKLAQDEGGDEADALMILAWALAGSPKNLARAR